MSATGLQGAVLATVGEWGKHHPLQELVVFVLMLAWLGWRLRRWRREYPRRRSVNELQPRESPEGIEGELAKLDRDGKG